MKQYERIKFKLFWMPCCHIQICWVNPRLPNYCPECGERVYAKLRTGAHTIGDDDNAVLETNLNVKHPVLPQQPE